MPDHVHLFAQINPTDTPTDVVKILKALTAVSVFDLYPTLKGNKFWGSGLWSRGTYYGTTGNVSQETIVKYIENQKTKRVLTSPG
jgi:putative transposase